MRNIKDLLQGINIGIAVGLALSENPENTLELYKNIMSASILPSKELTNNYTNFLKEHASEKFKNEDFNTAVLEYLDIFRNADMEPEEYRNTAICLLKLNQKDAAIEFLKKYEECAPNNPEIHKNIGLIYFNMLEDYQMAIEHFEKYVKIVQSDPEIYNVLGHLYSLHHKDKQLKKQLEYFMHAYRLRKNTRLYIRNVIFTLFRLGEYEQVEEFYQKLLKLNPTHSDYYYYGCFLISQNKIAEGYKYLSHRFEKEDGDKSIIPAVLPTEKLWHGEDLTGKTILVHCEQGFGDTILYSRFVKDISKKAKKVYFIVQEELFSLMNNSNLGAEIYSTAFELSRLDYDYFTTTVELAAYQKFTAEKIPYNKGYLCAKPINLTSDNLKIGFAYKGSNLLKSCERDIKDLSELFKLKDCQLYSLQVDGDLTLPDNVIDLGKDFKSFEDTANAIMAMDIIISTDNAILNLAGALGKKTLGVFNRFPEYRWINLCDKKETCWYNSVLAFQNKKQDDWEPTLKRITDYIKEGFL